jgi:class 3 adenylate cyclase
MDTAERRQVTVMFSDLVGSTALSTRMDPEDLREVISAYQKCVAETVRRFGGFVAKYMGDACSYTSVIRKRTRTTPSAQCGRGWS